ncbi:MAG: molybdopterin molybdotransferase MoeA [Planctomycetaceae bacterium]|nr:molybdopterin molybdotransferase MoeA [Planctomycetaceae bacterium]
MSSKPLPQLPKLNHPNEAIERICGLLPRLSVEQVEQRDALGRVLAESIQTDRPSPPLDVSAMDGFAFRLSELNSKLMFVSGTSQAGHPAPTLVPGQAVRIFTGAPVPTGADVVVKREDTDEQADRFELKVEASSLRVGQNIRRCGENAAVGSEVLAVGTEIGPAQMVAIATFASSQICVYRRARVAVINTGDELIEGGSPALPHQIRDSNGPLLESLVRKRAWLQLTSRSRVADRYEALRSHIEQLLKENDALLLTGGVSMGDTDHVPNVLRDLGAAIVFHKLPIRPGKPILGAVGPQGQAILGLPGNPVSVAATALRIAFPVLKHLSGFGSILPAMLPAILVDPDQKSIPLHWYRPVQFCRDSTSGTLQMRLTPNLGSGDVVALSASDAFVEIPLNESTHQGPWNCFRLE